jgi:hypothetical protein
LLLALWLALLGAGGCNNSFPTPTTTPVSGPGGSVGARGGSSGGAGATGAGATGGGATGGGITLDAGSGGPAVDAGPLSHCATVAPTGPIIADFDGLNNQAFGVFGVDPVIGATFVTPGALIQDFSNGGWHLTGSVTGSVSFGLHWQCPGVVDGVCTLDLSRYAGIQFTMDGNFGPTDTLKLSIGTIRDEAPGASACGVCNVPDGVETCTDPFATLSFATAIPPAMLSLTWLSFQSGDPYAFTDQQRVASITWTLPAAVDGGSYPVDFTLDDIRLIPIPH